MRIFLEPNYPKLYSLEKKYSSHLEAEQAITRYGINRVTCDNLRTLFYSKCSTNSYSMKSELLLETWIEWVNSYIHKDLATIIFKAKIDNFKPIWRFIDFVDFCVLFGSQNIETIATQLCKKFIESILFHRNLHSNSTNHGSYDNGSNQYNNSGNEDADSRNYSHSGDFLDYDGHEVTTESENNIEEDLRIGLRTMIQSLSLSTDHSGACYKTRSNSQVDNQSSQRSPNTTENSNQETIPISEIEQAEKAGIDGLTQFYANFIVTYEYELPGLLDLRLTACCLFSIPPPTPLLEKIFVTELTVRHIHTYPQTSTQPHGPVGTEWCVVWRPWYDAWRVYVGNHSKYVQKNNKDEPGDSPRLNSSSKSGNSRALKPLMIDNWNILRRTAARQLLPDVTLGQDIDILPPAVYFALHSWYGGGPRILRRVVPLLSPTTTPKVLSDASTASVSTINFSEVTELELYPLCVRVCLCDSNGKELPIERELLFSKTCTVQEMTSDLSRFRRIDESKVRLWNYADSDWKQQHVLPPDLNLIEAKIQDGQTIMMEISLMDGTWPRSQLHARLVVTGSNGSEEAEDEEDSSVSTSQDYILKHRAVGQKDTKEGIPKTQRRLNNGLVGLDNLGNTCYLNSSLQALVHTELLADYFLSKMYLKDINVKNIHGFKGRLAISFGKIVHDLWTTKQKELSPKNFLYDVASLRDQFAGNEQHDAHELLVFVIDGLSEDLNLVYKKPYTENPDSDGRPDEILANIWWENHLKRDRSIIQALFTGQYKSIMKCECGYSSARYEPFNFLTVPIPEETLRVFYVIVIPLQVEYSTKVAVKVNKTMGMVCDIIKEVILLDLPGTQRSATKDVESLPSTSNTEDNFIKPEDNRYKDVFFICGELLDSRIRSFNAMDRRVDTIKDNESIILFQVRRVPDELSIRVPHNRSIDSKLSDVKDLTSDSSNSIEENSKRAEEKELIESSEPPTNFRRISNSYFNDFLYRFTTYNHLVSSVHNA